MRSREFIKEASIRRIIIQAAEDALGEIVYILRRPNKGKDPVTGKTIPGDPVRDPVTGQTLAYPTQEAANAARKKMADSSATQGSADRDAFINSPNREVGKVGGTNPKTLYIPTKFKPSVDPSTGMLVQKTITGKDATGKDIVVTKTYKNWLDFVNRSGVNPLSSWRPGWIAQASQIASYKIPISGWLFTPADLYLIIKTYHEWDGIVEGIKKSYQENTFSSSDNGTADANAAIDKVNKEYLIKIAKILAVILITNLAGNTGASVNWGLRQKNINSLPGIADGITSLAKLSGKPINPTLAATLTSGGIEALKFLTASILSDTKLETDPANHPLINQIMIAIATVTDWNAAVANWIIKNTVGGGVGITPNDVEIMKKAAEKKGQTATKGQPATNDLSDLLDKVREP